jgi:acetolactate synthase-1/2/3 large subunit
MIDPHTFMESDKILEIFWDLEKAERPVILAGNGVHLSGGREELAYLAEQAEIPVVTSFLGVDLLPEDHPLNIGRVGIKGNRAANFAMQNSDLILSIGCRLSVPVTGYNYDHFAREAKLIVVDIDEFEHQKDTVRIDNFLWGDAKVFMEKLGKYKLESKIKWADQCGDWKEMWPQHEAISREPSTTVGVYEFMESLNIELGSDDIVVSDAGSAYYVVAQALAIRDEQRHITSGAQADMGFTIPAAIGAHYASGKRVIGITGDGSFQMNIQELQVIAQERLPIKIFVWNNDGYLSIRATQRKFFEGRSIGTGPDSGVTFPSLKKIADAYGIIYTRVHADGQMDSEIRKSLFIDGPVLCEVICTRDEEIVPTLMGFKQEDGSIVARPLEDMYPFMDRETFERNMIVKPLEESSAS